MEQHWTTGEIFPCCAHIYMLCDSVCDASDSKKHFFQGFLFWVDKVVPVGAVHSLKNVRRGPGTFRRFTHPADGFLCCTRKRAWTTLKSSKRNHVQKIVHKYLSSPKWTHSYGEFTTSRDVFFALLVNCRIYKS